MIGVDLLNELVNAVFLTGSLKNDAPQSLMLISSPESGKTSIVERSNLKTVLFYTDLIGSGILDELRNKPNVTHLVIRDMVMLMAHKDVTNKRTLGIIMALTEDGLGKVTLGKGLEMDFNGRRSGFVCCITSDMVDDERRWWNSSGFASRVIPFNYQYSENLQIAIINQTVINGAYEKKQKKESLKIPTIKFDIEVNGEMAKKIQTVAFEVAKHLEEKAIRRGKQFRALARAHALLKNRKQVDITDVQFLKNISGFISYRNSKELKYVRKKEDGTPQPQ